MFEDSCTRDTRGKKRQRITDSSVIILLIVKTQSVTEIVCDRELRTSSQQRVKARAVL